MDAAARRSKIAGIVLLGLGIAFYLAFAVGETAGGDITGLQHLLPAGILAVLIWMGWRRARRPGTILLMLALPFAVAYVAPHVVRDLPLIWAVFVALPPVLTGLLLVRGGRREPATR